MKTGLLLRQLFRTILIVGGIYGIILNILHYDSLLQSLSFYTIQSNIFIVVVMIIYLFKKDIPSKSMLIVKISATIGILLTFLVYHLVLYPVINLTGEYDVPFINDFLVHTFTPLLAITDYLLFDKKGSLKYRDAFWFLSLPVFYFIYAQIYAFSGGIFKFESTTSRYAYFFLNADKIGWGMVAIYSAALLVIIYLISLLQVFVDKLQFNRKEGVENV